MRSAFGLERVAACPAVEMECPVLALDAREERCRCGGSRIVALAMRTGWGRFPDAPLSAAPAVAPLSAAERLALHITNRSFWGRGSITSEPSTLMLRLPLVDRLALEMAANEDTERRAMAGELLELERAWRDAEEVAAIADGMFGPAQLEEFRQAHEARQLARASRPGG